MANITLVLHVGFSQTVGTLAFNSWPIRIGGSRAATPSHTTGHTSRVSGGSAGQDRQRWRRKNAVNWTVVFSCNFSILNFKSPVSASDIRGFRGSMIGRSDKGLFISTGTFPGDAIQEATRDGAPLIDLIDGDQLADILKELGHGIKKEMIEKLPWILNV